LQITIVIFYFKVTTTIKKVLYLTMSQCCPAEWSSLCLLFRRLGFISAVTLKRSGESKSNCQAVTCKCNFLISYAIKIALILSQLI